MEGHFHAFLKFAYGSQDSFAYADKSLTARQQVSLSLGLTNLLKSAGRKSDAVGRLFLCTKSITAAGTINSTARKLWPYAAWTSSRARKILLRLVHKIC